MPTSVASSASSAPSTSNVSLACVSTGFFLPIASSFSFNTSTSGNVHGSRCFASTRALASSLRAFTNVSVMTSSGMRFAVKVVPTSSKLSSSPSTKEAFFSCKYFRTAISSATCSGVKSRVTVPTVTFRCTVVSAAFVSNIVFPCSAVSTFFSTAAFPVASCSETTDSAFLCIVLPLVSSPSATCSCNPTKPTIAIAAIVAFQLAFIVTSLL